MHTVKRRLKSSKAFMSGIGMLLVLALLAACNDTTTVKPAPTALPIQFTALNLGIPAVALNAPVTGNVPDAQILHVGVSFKLNQDVMNKLKQQKAKKGTNSDVTGIANQLGITDQEYQHFKSYFGIENATLTLNKLHTYMNVDAKASTFAKLLQTRFLMHKLNNKTFFTPDPSMPPKLPSAIASQILTVTGLDNYGTQQKIGSAFTPAVASLPHVMQRVTRSTRSSAQTTTRKAASDCTVDPNTLSMQQIAHAYGYDAYWQQGFHGENMTVNLVEIDGFNPDDVLNYFSCFNVSQDNLKVINVDGAPASAEGETNLDIDMIAGLVPAAMINDYQVGQPTSNDINDALQQIINDNANNTNTASVVSISLGAAENGTDPSMLTAIDSSLQQLTQVEHMTVFVATGDCAAFADGNYNELSVNFPASDPYAVAVGGTELQVNENGSRNQEVVWSDGTDQNT
ncbi:MAG TPA: hypothetical protein DHW02_13090 [Ktedonobacter sp.]|nr:hypothetical protein [Ktedonobacter sp.]